MKVKLVSLLVLAATVFPAAASITLGTQFGTAYDTSGATVADGTLWILVVDSNKSSSFSGLSGLNTSLGGTSTTTDAFTQGQTLTLGSLLGGDTIFAMGGFNGVVGAGTTQDSVTFSLATGSIEAGMNFAFYFFPGTSYTQGATVATITGTQAGGVTYVSQPTDAGLDAGMVIPSDGANLPAGAATTDLGGSVTNAQFKAVSLVPEPSAALLGLLGVAGLLRRRR